MATYIKILTFAILGVLVIPAFLPISPMTRSSPAMVSYNPAPAGNFHAPLSSVALIAVANATPNVQSMALSSSSSRSQGGSAPTTIRQNALRFINDTSYFGQSETSIAVDPNNSSHVVAGFNDGKYLLCPALPADCGSAIPASLSGFTTSTDGGKSVAKGSDLPGVNFFGTFLASWGDPSVAPTVDGNFFFASLAINPLGVSLGNGVMIAKSNSNLFNPNVSCVTSAASPLSNPCWSGVFVVVSTGASLDDKDRIAVDRAPASPYYGSVYIGWDHFSPNGLSASFLVRCDKNLAACTFLSPTGGRGPVVSGTDPFVAWTTPIVDKNGNVYVSWCNFGTFITFGPVVCKISSSPPGGESFGPFSTIISYMGSQTTLPTDTVVIGWATEQFRVGAGLISLATDTSSKSNNLYFTTSVCTAGHYYAFSPATGLPVAADNPGDCGHSAVIFEESTNGGLSWSNPLTISNPAVNDQPYVTVDSQTGSIYVVYYTTQYDPFDHRIDVVASISNNQGRTFHQQRVTMVSDEPNADPNMFDYLSAGIGGSFQVPQYGDYFEATARAGTLWVLFTGNYAVEQGTFQTDPFLAVVNGI